MYGTCDCSVETAAFEVALASIRPRSERAIRAIALSPAGDGLALEIRTGDFTASATLPREGPWDARVVVQGPSLARLAGKLGDGRLKLVYEAGRLSLNRLALPAKEEAAPKQPLPAMDTRVVGCIDPPGPFSDPDVLFEFLESLADDPPHDPVVISLRREYEAYIRAHRRRAH